MVGVRVLVTGGETVGDGVFVQPKEGSPVIMGVVVGVTEGLGVGVRMSVVGVGQKESVAMIMSGMLPSSTLISSNIDARTGCITLKGQMA
jgi:hypothetical protein